MGWTIEREGKVFGKGHIDYIKDVIHSRYVELDMKIYIYEDIETMVDDWWVELGYWDVWDRLEFLRMAEEGFAFAMKEQNRLFINEEHLVSDVFMQGVQEKEWIPYVFTYTMFHEIRHIWQYAQEVENEWKEEEMKEMDGDYYALSYERDANQFAVRMMNNHKDYWNNVFGGVPEWSWVYLWVIDTAEGRKGYMKDIEE